MQDTETWKFIRAQCDDEQILPEPTAEGLSLELSGTSLFGDPPDPKTLSGQLRLLRDLVSAFEFEGRLGIDVAPRLNKILDQVTLRFLEGRAMEGSERLGRFIAVVEEELAKGLIDAGSADALVDQALIVQDFIFSGSMPPLLPPPPGPLSCPGGQGPCKDTLSSWKFTEFHVDDDAADRLDPERPDGSLRHPFPSIVAALTRAAELDACGIVLRVGRRFYVGDIRISRHTKIFLGKNMSPS